MCGGKSWIICTTSAQIYYTGESGEAEGICLYNRQTEIKRIIPVLLVWYRKSNIITTVTIILHQNINTHTQPINSPPHHPDKNTINKKKSQTYYTLNDPAPPPYTSHSRRISNWKTQGIRQQPNASQSMGRSIIPVLPQHQQSFTINVEGREKNKKTCIGNNK